MKLSFSLPSSSGRVVHVDLASVSAVFPDAMIGGIVEVERMGRRPLLAEVIAIQDHRVTLAPWGETVGVRVDATVHFIANDAMQLCPDRSRGAVVCALGKDLHSGESLTTAGAVIETPSIRERVARKVGVNTGLRAVDTLLPMVEGQRIGIFAGAGVGKTTLLTQLAQQVHADRVVLCLIGERSREAVSLVDSLRELSSWERTTTIVATADKAAALRVRAGELAMNLAMQSRARGEHCLVLFDSLTRWVRAKREIALLSGERPGRGGFPPSALAALAPLIETAGATHQGAVTSFFTVLLEGDEMDDPVGDEVRGLVEGHWILSRRQAERQLFPAIDLRASLSRLAEEAVPQDYVGTLRKLRAAWSALEELYEAEAFGLYAPGENARLDAIASHRELFAQFQRQDRSQESPRMQSLEDARQLADYLESAGVLS